MNRTVLIDHGITVRRESTPECDIRIELPVLIEIHHAQLLGQSNATLRRLDLSAQKTEKRCLAAAVRAYHADSHARLDHHPDLREERAFFDLVCHVIELNELLGSTLGR